MLMHVLLVQYALFRTGMHPFRTFHNYTSCSWQRSKPWKDPFGSTRGARLCLPPLAHPPLPWFYVLLTGYAPRVSIRYRESKGFGQPLVIPDFKVWQCW